MNIIAVLVAGYACFSLELGLRKALAVGSSGIAPSFVFVLCVLISLSAPSSVAMWTCLILGLITDLTWPHEIASGVSTATIMGPYAIGYLVACQFVLSIRGNMFRRNPLTLGFLCGFGMAIAQIVVVALYTFRSGYTEIQWDPTSQLLARLGSALYTGILGIAVGIFAGPITSALGVHQPPQRRFTRPIY
ncbi:MAG: rod shape-determining protein MreD [Phycisphaerales bacterium]|nr:rod shape-determining protein MreD [Phycisphaerales bacterium]